MVWSERTETIPFVKTPYFVSSSSVLLNPGLTPVLLNQVQRLILESVLAGGDSIEDLAHRLASETGARNESVRAKVAAFVASLDFVGTAKCRLLRDLDVVIVDRGWGGVAQQAIDLLEALTRRGLKAVLMTAHAPRYGCVPDDNERILHPAAFGLADGDFVPFMSLMRSLILKTKTRLILCAHRAVAPYLFDIASKRAVILHGDDYLEFNLGLGRHQAANSADQPDREMVQELYWAGEHSRHLGWSKAFYLAYARAAENWFYSPGQRERTFAFVPPAGSHDIVLPFVESSDFDHGYDDTRSDAVLFAATGATGELGIKGLSPLVEALREVPEIGLQVAAFDARECAPYRSSFGKRLSVFEAVSKVRMARLYREAFAFCRVSRSDSTPIAVIEAMAHGTPVIVSPLIAQNMPLIQHGVSGFVISPDEPHELRKTILLLHRDAALRKRIGLAGRERITSRSLDDRLEERFLHERLLVAR